LIKGFEIAEKKFIEENEKENEEKIDKSGSCALVAMIISQNKKMIWFI